MRPPWVEHLLDLDDVRIEQVRLERLVVELGIENIRFKDLRLQNLTLSLNFPLLFHLREQTLAQLGHLRLSGCIQLSGDLLHLFDDRFYILVVENERVGVIGDCGEVQPVDQLPLEPADLEASIAAELLQLGHGHARKFFR